MAKAKEPVVNPEVPQGQDSEPEIPPLPGQDFADNVPSKESHKDAGW